MQKKPVSLVQGRANVTSTGEAGSIFPPKYRRRQQVVMEGCPIVQEKSFDSCDA